MSGIGQIDLLRQAAQGLARALPLLAGGTGRIDGRATGLTTRALNGSGASIAAGTIVKAGGEGTTFGNIIKVTTTTAADTAVGITIDAAARYTPLDILTLGFHPTVLSTGTINPFDLLYPSSTAGYVTASVTPGAGPIGYAVTSASGTSTVAVWFDPGWAAGYAAARPASALNIPINGGASVIGTGRADYAIRVKGSYTITGWAVYTDLSGAATLDIWKVPHASYPPTVSNSITNTGTKPTSGSARKNASTDLTSWTTDLLDGDVLMVAVDSNTANKWLTLTLDLRRTG